MAKAMAKTARIRESRADVVYNAINVALLIFLLVIVAYPLYFVVIASVSTPVSVSMGKVFLWPDGINLAGYKTILEYELIWSGYRNSILYTAAATLLHVAFTVAAGHNLYQSRSYASMAFCGEDLLVLSRTGDENAYNGHDTNIISFHRVKHFRDLIDAEW